MSSLNWCVYTHIVFRAAYKCVFIALKYMRLASVFVVLSANSSQLYVYTRVQINLLKMIESLSPFM